MHGDALRDTSTHQVSHGVRRQSCGSDQDSRPPDRPQPLPWCVRGAALLAATRSSRPRYWLPAGHRASSCHAILNDGFPCQQRYRRLTVDIDRGCRPFRWTAQPSTIHSPHMDRRNPVPEPHPLVSGFPCPSCSSVRVRLATVADFFFYLRCDSCTFVWSHPERRQIMDRRRAAQHARDSRAS